MDKLDMFQDRFVKVDEFGWWDLEIISADLGTQFTPTEFQDKCQNCGVWLTLAGPEHQELNGQAKLTWRMLRTIAHSLMVHAQVPEAYIYFSLFYTPDHIFLVLPIKDLINEDGESTLPFNLATDTKTSILYLRVLFCPCVVRKATVHDGTQSLNMCHQAQKGLCGIFVGIPKHQKW